MPAHVAVWPAPPLRLPPWVERARTWVLSLARAANASTAPDPAARRREDVALARRVRRGDSRAEGELLERLLPHLRVVARAILHNPADVDDAVQVALMRVLEGLPTYRGDSSLVRWSRRVAAHACLRLREQNQRRLRVVELSAEVPAAPEPAPVPSLGEGLPRELEEYLGSLSEPQREALVLRHVLDHSVAEVAQLVGAPVDTVKSRLLYGRRALRALIRRDAALAPRREGAGG
ncbi:MAG: RNA polymerase sigma factor [Myxococcota bacterium]